MNQPLETLGAIAQGGAPSELLHQLADRTVWQQIGYRPFPLGEPTLGPPNHLPTIGINAVRDGYDVVVIGSGAGGAIAAMVLAEAGASVLVVERGRLFGRGQIPTDHLRNHRLPVLGDSTSPAGHPRAVPGTVPDFDLSIEPMDFRYQNNAITVGGGTRLFGAQAWRFLPEDFQMASIYGVPEGSALADWPIGYDDLAPFYSKVETAIGVAGSATHREEPLRGRSYPMPAFAPNAEARILAAGAASLGWETGPVPLLANSVARDGRPACVNCGFCVGFACPVEAKNGVDATALPRAVRAGAELVVDAQVVAIDDDGTVSLRADGVLHSIHAGRIVVAAGAIETARLLQLSRLGNDWVGDCLQGHVYPAAFGLFDEHVIDGIGPGPGIATRRFSHGNDGVVGGGLLANDFVKLPALFASWALPPDAPRTLDSVKDLYARIAQVTGPLQEIPIRAAQVRLSTSVRDACGLPVARLAGTQHAENDRTAEFMAARGEEWLRASGATRTWRTVPSTATLSAGQHQAGTTRMSSDARFGATDVWGKLWGSDRIWVADSSVHVTNGGANPVLTIMALAWRTAAHIAGL